MTVAVDPAFSRELVMLAAAFDKELTQARIKMYAMALADADIAQIRDAVQRAVRECTYFPSAAELRRFIGPTPDDAGLIAWTGLCRAASEVGAYATLEVQDGHAADALLAVFGCWREFCEKCEADGGWGQKRQEFLAAYRQSQRHKTTNDRRLPGICESDSGRSDRSWSGRLTALGLVESVRPPQHQLTGVVDGKGVVAGHLTGRSGGDGAADLQGAQGQPEAGTAPDEAPRKAGRHPGRARTGRRA